MFTKHTYTCPDVIYMRKRNRRITLANLGITVVLGSAAYAYGWYVERKEARERQTMTGI